MCHGIGPYFFFGFAAGFLPAAFLAGFFIVAFAARFLAGAAFFSAAVFSGAAFLIGPVFAGFASVEAAASGFFASTFGSDRATLVCDGFLPSVRISVTRSSVKSWRCPFLRR